MSDQTAKGWGECAGVPRECIPWYPTIEAVLCQPARCKLECIAWCQEQVYALQEDGTVVVARPYACNVGDASRSFQCSFEAIRFPGRRELSQILKAARQG